MEAVKLRAEIREDIGKAAARRIRREGFIPAVLYGREVGNVSMKVRVKDVEKIFDNAADRGLIKILLQENGKKEEYITLIREVQRDPVKRNLLHVDFYQISLKEKFQTQIPVHLVGEAPGVREGGVLQYGARFIEVECRLADLPEVINVDISKLGLGDKITVADLPETPGVEFLSEPETLLASVVVPRMVTEVEEEAEEVPGEGTEEEQTEASEEKEEE